MPALSFERAPLKATGRSGAADGPVSTSIAAVGGGSTKNVQARVAALPRRSAARTSMATDPVKLERLNGDPQARATPPTVQASDASPAPVSEGSTSSGVAASTYATPPTVAFGDPTRRRTSGGIPSAVVANDAIADGFPRPSTAPYST